MMCAGLYHKCGINFSVLVAKSQTTYCCQLTITERLTETMIRHAGK